MVKPISPDEVIYDENMSGYSSYYFFKKKS